MVTAIPFLISYRFLLVRSCLPADQGSWVLSLPTLTIGEEKELIPPPPPSSWEGANAMFLGSPLQNVEEEEILFSVAQTGHLELGE